MLRGFRRMFSCQWDLHRTVVCSLVILYMELAYSVLQHRCRAGITLGRCAAVLILMNWFLWRVDAKAVCSSHRAPIEYREYRGADELRVPFCIDP